MEVERHHDGVLKREGENLKLSDKTKKDTCI